MNQFASYRNGSRLFHRYQNNPILTPSQWPYAASAVFNPAA
ncbi:MAG: glycosidase, partial [Deltaproteobacteria bacterium]